MTDSINNGGPAFPCYVYGTHGMTLRDWFAGQALVGATQIIDNDYGAIAREAYRYADAMLDARK